MINIIMIIIIVTTVIITLAYYSPFLSFSPHPHTLKIHEPAGNVEAGIIITDELTLLKSHTPPPVVVHGRCCCSANPHTHIYDSGDALSPGVGSYDDDASNANDDVCNCVRCAPPAVM